MNDEQRQQLLDRHYAASHAVQTGVMYELHQDPRSGEPKHLRTGLNVALCDHSALAQLLIRKGLMTEEEYLTAIAEEMEAEKRRYEERLSGTYGTKITLG